MTLCLPNTEETLEVLLREYPSALRMLRRAEYKQPNVLVGHLRVEPGWAVKTDDPQLAVNHFTLGESTYCHNQRGYVLTACMAQAGAFENVPPLTLEAINKKKFNMMVVTQYDCNFRKAFSSTEEFIGTLTLTQHRTMRAPSGYHIFARYAFDFMDGKAYGTSKAAVKLEIDELSRKIGA